MKKYIADRTTKEYIGSRELTDRDKNPKYSPETHVAAEEYIYDPRYESLDEPMAAPENKKQVLADDGWSLVDDYRGQCFWDTITKTMYTITALGTLPESTWTDQEPNAWQIWNGTTWEDDFELWLDIAVRPERDLRMNEFEWRVNRCLRETRNNGTTTEDISLLDAYMQALADLPETLTTVVDPIPWPTKP